MDGASVMRLRWRLHGAWMWPAFIVLTLADGLLANWLPIAGDSESPVAGALLGAFLGLAAIVFVAPPLGMLMRRLRRDMPRIVARDYAGATALIAITAAFLVIGLVHHQTVLVDRHALEDAVARAEAFIGERAPDQFRQNLASADTFELQPPLIYRTCVNNFEQTETYCVVVNRSKPFANSVTVSGSEPNRVLSQGTG